MEEARVISIELLTGGMMNSKRIQYYRLLHRNSMFPIDGILSTGHLVAKQEDQSTPVATVK